MSDQTVALVARLRRQVPPDLAERARAFTAGGQAPAPLRDASTVVLLRDTPTAGIEAYLLRRVSTMAFAGGMHVFPGGRVDPADNDDLVPWIGPDVAELAPALGADGDFGLARGLVCAAVRETFEECGVLLASPHDGPGELTDLDNASWTAEREALESRRTHLTEMLGRRSLALRADLLRPWARWVTPDVEPKRYDTRFFVAALPPGQQPGAASGEADRMFWIKPAEALERQESGNLDMLPPTVFTLAELCAYADVAAVLEAARQRDVGPVMPTIMVSGDEAQFLVPHDTPNIPNIPTASVPDTADTTP